MLSAHGGQENRAGTGGGRVIAAPDADANGGFPLFARDNFERLTRLFGSGDSDDHSRGFAAVATGPAPMPARPFPDLGPSASQRRQ
jgi:hypothetical protein